MNSTEAITRSWASIKGVAIRNVLRFLSDNPNESIHGWFSDAKNQLVNCKKYFRPYNHYACSKSQIEDFAGEVVCQIWEICENSKNDILAFIDERPRDEATPSLITILLRRELDKGRDKYLRDHGYSNEYIKNLYAWYRIYPIAYQLHEEFKKKKLTIEWSHSEFINALSQKITSNKRLKTVSDKGRLLNMILEFNSNPYFIDVEHLTVDDIEPEPFDFLSDNEIAHIQELEQISDDELDELKEIDGATRQLRRLEDCFKRLEDSSTQMHEILTRLVINQENPPTIYRSMGIKRKTMWESKEKAIELLNDCLEYKGELALSQLRSEL